VEWQDNFTKGNCGGNENYGGDGENCLRVLHVWSKRFHLRELNVAVPKEHHNKAKKSSKDEGREKARNKGTI
jgi:hypothetical protein